MKYITLKRLGAAAIIIVLVFANNVYASDKYDWITELKLQLQKVPLDVTFTQDGKLIFVLTDQGEILIYLSTGKLIDRIDVGKHVDKIEVSRKGEALILNSRKNKTVSVINLVSIQKFNISDSPFRGMEDAPIVIVSFDDFQ